VEFRQPDVDWAALSPELILLGGSAIVLLAALFVPVRARNAFSAVVAALALVGALAAAALLFAADDTAAGVVENSLRRDRLAEAAQVVLALAGLLAVGVSYAHLEARERAGEYYALVLAAVSGMAFFVAANNLMTLFLGLEWFSISLYILTAVAVERLSALEAGLKYLVVGSFGSAVLLFGSALVYGATGAIRFDEIAAVAGDADPLLFGAGLALILVGLGFKMSAAPFHMWTPDVYEGAPTPVTAFMAAATKVAALVLALRVLVSAFGADADLWTWALAALAVVSLAWGNLAALVQTDVKRMLAYSSISHAGFLLMPVAAANELGGRALLYYLVAYSAMTVGAFGVVAVRERELGTPVTFANIAGFGWERPFYGTAMAVFMFGFIGLPPAGLFLGKVLAFGAAIERGWWWLAIVGVAATVISIYYYLGIVRAMFMQLPEPRVVPAGGSPPRDAVLATTVTAALVVTIGSLVAADPLLEWARDAADVLRFPH
jgi:NADH-quinone oxidoreductase subunit N